MKQLGAGLENIAGLIAEPVDDVNLVLIGKSGTIGLSRCRA